MNGLGRFADGKFLTTGEKALVVMLAAGIAIAVVRAGDDLAVCLSGEPATENAHA